MSNVVFYSFFCGFVLFLFNSLHPSDQSSVQNLRLVLSAQPSVTAAISKISARLALDSSESLLSPSVASFGQIASAITSIASAHKAAQDASEASTASAAAQGQEDVVTVSADPIMVINSQDSEAMESALLRTEVSLAGVTASRLRAFCDQFGAQVSPQQ